MKTKATILDVRYKSNDNIVKCYITYIDPFANCKCVSIGVAKCNPKDTYRLKKGMHISEGRAKYQIYDKLRCSIFRAINQLNLARWDYNKLSIVELNHLSKLINT